MNNLPLNSGPPRSIFRDLFRRFWWLLLILFLAGAFQSTLNGLYTLSIAPLADLLVSGQGEPSGVTNQVARWLERFGISYSLFTASVLVGVSAVIFGLSSIITTYISTRVKYRLLEALLTTLLQKISQAEYRFSQSERMGLLLNSLEKEAGKLGDILGQLISGLVSIMQIAVLVSVPFALNSSLAAQFLLAGLIATAPLWFLKKLSLSWGAKNVSTANEVSSSLYDILTSLKLIRIFGTAEFMTSRYRDNFRAHADSAVVLFTLISSVGSVVLPLGVVALLIIVNRAYLHSTSFSDLAVMLFAFTRMLPLLGGILKLKVSFEGFAPAFRQIGELQTRAAEAQERIGGISVGRLRDRVTFSNVCFSYTKGNPTLKNLNFEIAKGEFAVFTGRSGSGKSTICDLTLGLLRPISGEIFIDGAPLSTSSLNDWRKRIGYVPQDSRLFDATLRENLEWGRLEPLSDDAMIQACKKANALEFILALPDGFETEVGDRGDKLSGGQRQRIALARALCRSPDLLVLDEATSALDNESERLIIEALHELKGRVTILMISHRTEILKDADKVYRLVNGTLSLNQAI